MRKQDRYSIGIPLTPCLLQGVGGAVRGNGVEWLCMCEFAHARRLYSTVIVLFGARGDERMGYSLPPGNDIINVGSTRQNFYSSKKKTGLREGDAITGLIKT